MAALYMRPSVRSIKLMWSVGLIMCFVSPSLSISEASADTLAADLALQSTNEGLGIVRYAGHSKLEVLSLDGKATITSFTVPGLDGLYDLQPITQVLLGSNKGLQNTLETGGISALGTASMALLTLNGRQLKSVGLSSWPISVVVSPKLDLLAVLAYTTADGVSFKYGPLDWASPAEVFTLDISERGSTPNYHPESFSWSPDEQFLVYSLKGEVFIFDTSNGTRRSIAEGTDPCWSPDGASIAYRSKNLDLMVYKMATGASERLTEHYNVVGFPKWSPDSRYILFTEFSPWLAIRNPLTMPTTDFVVIRVSDRAIATVFTPGMGMDNRRFFWIKTGSKSTTPKH
jgi:WD40 repeat protein